MDTTSLHSITGSNLANGGMCYAKSKNCKLLKSLSKFAQNRYEKFTILNYAFFSQQLLEIAQEKGTQLLHSSYYELFA